jgi:hypothetical protein
MVYGGTGVFEMTTKVEVDKLGTKAYSKNRSTMYEGKGVHSLSVTTYVMHVQLRSREDEPRNLICTANLYNICKSTCDRMNMPLAPKKRYEVLPENTLRTDCIVNDNEHFTIDDI